MDYNDLISGLKSSQVQDYQPDPVLTEKVNDAAAFGKNFLGGTGAMLEGDAIKKTFKQLSKQGSEGLLKQLDLNEEDMNDLVEKISSGDTEGVAKVIGERGINIARNKLGSFIRDTKGSARKLYQSLKAKAAGRDAEPTAEESGEPASASEVAAAPRVAETAFPTEISSQIPEGAGAVQGQALEQSLQGGRGLTEEQAAQFTEQPKETSSAADTELTDSNEMTSNVMKTAGDQRAADSELSADKDLGDVGKSVGKDAEADASQIGSKVVDGLDELTAESSAFDETPIGIGVTALLGLGSLIGGIFVKTHHDAFTRPPIPHQMATTYAVGKGIF